MKAIPLLFISFLAAILPGALAQDRGKVHSFHLRDAELRSALDSLIRWYDVSLLYLEKDIDGKKVTTACSDCAFMEALEKVIGQQGLNWKMIGEQVLLQRRAIRPIDSAVTFSGRLRDSLTGDPVYAANVVLFDAYDSTQVYRWCTTNQFGFLSLRNIHPGAYVLTIRRVGYRTYHERLNILPGAATVRDIPLLQEELLQPEVTIEEQRSAFAASEAISRGVFIRATPMDQNQYFLEGARIYNPVHFGGVMSTFNADALSDVQVVAGGVPPYYGGRIGGILNLFLHEGAGEKITGSGAVGSFGSSLALEGPVSGGTTFVVSGREEYPDAFVPRLHSEKTPSDLNSSEIIAKLSRHLSPNQTLSLSGYYGRDEYQNSIVSAAGDHLANSLGWRNSAANMQWLGVVSPSLFFSASAVFTRYAFDAAHALETTGIGTQEFVSHYHIEDASVRAYAEYTYDEYHTMLAGAELVHHGMAGSISAFSSQIAPMSFDEFSPWELSAHLQDQWRLVPSVLAELGARATSFIGRQGNFSAVDPRLSLLLSPNDDLHLYSSLTAVSQFVHPYRQSGIFLFYPSIFFYPSTVKMRPSTSLQISLGAEQFLDENRYRVAIESYYRTTQNLHDFVFDTTAGASLEDASILGEENVYGAELTIDKRTGKFAGSVRYSLTWANDQFPELNNGAPFTPRFDRRHELYASVSYLLRENLAIGAVCLLASSQFPSFAPAGLGAKVLPANLDTRETGGPGQALNGEQYDLNGGRLPRFQRLEFRLMHSFGWWGVPFQAEVRMLNGYGLIDPFVWALRRIPDERLKWSAGVDPPPLFPLYPVVSVSARF